MEIANQSMAEVSPRLKEHSPGIDIELNRLPADQQKVLHKLADTISKRVDTAFVFCFAFQQYEVHRAHCFDIRTDKQWLHADILLVYQDDEQRGANQIQYLVNSVDLEECQYAVVIMRYAEVMERLDAKEPFVCNVFRHGALLYSHTDNLPKYNKGVVCYETLLQQTKEGWCRWFTNSCQFMDCATYCLMEHKYKMAVFMVHQTVEQACKAMLKVMLHMRPNTHNLTWMLKLCSTLAPEIASVFPRDSPQEQSLFNKLKSSYMDSRYAATFTISEEDTWVLYYRAAAILRIAGNLCNKRIAEMEKLLV